MKHFLLPWFGLILAVSMFSCISSEESGSSSQQAPITQQEPADSVARGTRDAAQASQTGKQQTGQKGSRLTSRQDTLVASVTRKAKPASRSSRLVRPNNPLYTVQVGVFRKAQNALRYQKLAKERFPKNSVHNRYDTKTKMYWVSIGRFTTKQEAVALRRTVIDKYPKDYKEAWVNYIPR